MHIKQIGSDPYTIVNTEGFKDILKHPSIVDHPDVFEIVEGELPKDYQTLNYQSDI